MTEWNEQHLKELAQKMESENSREVSLDAGTLLSRIMSLDAATWSALGYAETDRVSLVRHLGSLGCRVDWILSSAVIDQSPLDLELARLLIKMGAFNNRALSYAVETQQPLSFELAKLPVDAGVFREDALSAAAEFQRPLIFELADLFVGCNPAAQDDDGWGWDALVSLAYNGRPVDPQVTDLFLSAGCRTDLDGCEDISDGHYLRFGQILKEHTE